MSNMKTTAALLASLGFNIFCVAFFLGRVSGPGMLPPPGFGRDGMPPHEHGFEHDGHFGHEGQKGMPPRPPMFTPDLLFTHEEMEQHFADMKKNFSKVQSLGTAFADKLEKGPVSKEEVAQYIGSVDTTIDAARKAMREKAIDKISTMSEEDRKKLAGRLRERCQENPHPDDKPGDGPKPEDDKPADEGHQP